MQIKLKNAKSLAQVLQHSKSLHMVIPAVTAADIIAKPKLKKISYGAACANLVSFERAILDRHINDNNCCDGSSYYTKYPFLSEGSFPQGCYHV